MYKQTKYKQTKFSCYPLMAIATILSLGSIAIAPDSANGQLLQHDTGNGVNTKNAISVPINSSHSGTNPDYNPTTGRVNGDGLFTDINLTPDATEDSFESSTNQPQEVSVNNVAELLQTDIDRSLEQLSKVEEAVKTAEAAPRRIARRRNVAEDTRACINPAIQVRQKVAEKLEQSRDFIEEVNQIDPNNGLW